MFLESDRLYFRELRESDLTETYRGWMTDREVTRYFETRFYPITENDFYDYWVEHSNKKDEPWFGIFIKKESIKYGLHNPPPMSPVYVYSLFEHIGNIKLGPINWIHRRSDLSLFIGKRDLWGKGYGSEAIKTISKYAFDTLNLHKLTAGIYAANIGSIRAFEKAGFQQEATLNGNVWCDGNWMDVLLMARFRYDNG